MAQILAKVTFKSTEENKTTQEQYVIKGRYYTECVVKLIKRIGNFESNGWVAKDIDITEV